MRRLIVSVLGMLATATWVNAAPLNVQSFDFQSGSESVTAAPAITGDPTSGAQAYHKLVILPPGTAIVRFHATGDSHSKSVKGAVANALLMTATINGVPLQPFATAGGSALVGAPWIPMVKLPVDHDHPVDEAGCDDGLGGPGDCHDNSFSWAACLTLGPNPEGPRLLAIRLGSEIPGQDVFYEDSTIEVDWTSDKRLCTRVPVEAGAGD